VILKAQATDSDGSITNVAFYSGTNTFIANVTTTNAQGLYEYTWTNRTNGTYSVYARASDNKSGTGNSQIEVFTVNTNLTFPTVSIISPTNGAVIKPCRAFAIEATATPAGQIK